MYCVLVISFEPGHTYLYTSRNASGRTQQREGIRQVYELVDDLFLQGQLSQSSPNSSIEVELDSEGNEEMAGSGKSSMIQKMRRREHSTGD
jgi:hypothetical protein